MRATKSSLSINVAEKPRDGDRERSYAEVFNGSILQISDEDEAKMQSHSVLSEQMLTRVSTGSIVFQKKSSLYIP